VQATNEAVPAETTTAPELAATSAAELVPPARPTALAPAPVAQRAVAAANPTRAMAEAQPKNAPSVTGFDAASTNSAPETTLREETRLIDGALAALRAGDRTRAAALLGEHAQRFPNGLLRRERARALHKLDELNAIEP
jgi:TolA-binding protein